MDTKDNLMLIPCPDSMVHRWPTITNFFAHIFVRNDRRVNWPSRLGSLIGQDLWNFVLLARYKPYLL